MTATSSATAAFCETLCRHLQSKCPIHQTAWFLLSHFVILQLVFARFDCLQLKGNNNKTQKKLILVLISLGFHALLGGFPVNPLRTFLFAFCALFSMKLAHFFRPKHVAKAAQDLWHQKPFWPSVFQVDVNSKRHGGELVASVLKAHGVQEVFTLCGGHISPILTGCQSLGICIVDTRHEATAVYAADAVARLRQSFGVAAVTAGPGITNTVTALKNAQMAESPVLLLGGSAPSLAKGRGALQDIDQMALLKPLCKFTARALAVRDIVPALREAIAVAQSGTPGPVFVELPIDVLYPFQLVAKEAGIGGGTDEGTSKRSILSKKGLVDAYLSWYVHSQFSEAFTDDQPLTPLPVRVPMPSLAQCQQLASILRSAKRPLLLVGSQAMLAPVKPDQLVKALEKLGVPVFLGGMARGLMGRSHPLNIRQNRREALREADCVILAGAVCDFRLAYGKTLPKGNGAKIVTINRDKGQMLKNEGVFWRSTVSVQADVASTLVGLADTLGSDWKGASGDWRQQLADADARKEAQNAAKAASVKTPDGHLNPLAVLNALEKVLPQDAILVADGGDFVGSAAYIVRPRGPLQWLDPGPFGTLGVGAGFALGAKCVHGAERPVLIIYGDGACGFSIAEFDTFVRHQLPVMALIGNDACWSQIARDQVTMLGSDVGCQLTYTRYDEVAQGFGAEGKLFSIENKVDDSEKLEKELGEVFAASSGNRSPPLVINAVIGRSDFREGSISV